MDRSRELKPEVRLPLEILANLIYLTKHHADDSTKVAIYMDMADKSFVDLLSALKQQINLPGDAE